MKSLSWKSGEYRSRTLLVKRYKSKPWNHHLRTTPELLTNSVYCCKSEVKTNKFSSC